MFRGFEASHQGFNEQDPIVMSFTESNTVEQMILGVVAKRGGTEPWVVREDAPGCGESLGGELRPTCWGYLPASQLPRQIGDVMVELWLREALIRLNPEIAAQAWYVYGSVSACARILL
jgi:type I restriction enzyme R subunit